MSPQSGTIRLARGSKCNEGDERPETQELGSRNSNAGRIHVKTMCLQIAVPISVAGGNDGLFNLIFGFVLRIKRTGGHCVSFVLIFIVNLLHSILVKDFQ